MIIKKMLVYVKYKKYPVFSFRDHYSFKDFALELLTYMSWVFSFFVVLFYCSISRCGSSSINQNAIYSKTNSLRDSFFIRIWSQII